MLKYILADRWSMQAKLSLYRRRGHIRKPPPKSAAIPVADPMKLWNSYYRAKSISDALRALAAAGGPTGIVAGGTDLLLDMQQGRHAPVETLVDVTAIPEMCVIEIREGQLFIGGAVPISQIVRSDLVRQHAQAVVEACDLIGGPQVRNTATLGGNVAHALPAADGTISLIAMDAVADIADQHGIRQTPLEELFRGPGKSMLQPATELLVGFRLPLSKAGQASAFKRVMRPQGVALPILNMAAWLARADDRISDVRLAVGPSGPTPRRAVGAEACLVGRHPDGDALSESLDALLEESHFRTSPMRATATYRRHLAGNLLKEVIETAWKRSAG